MLRRPDRPVLLVLILLAVCGPLLAAEPEKKSTAPQPPAAEEPSGSEGIPPEAGLIFRGPLASWRTQTLGGVQLWADELCYDHWHIQRNVVLGLCRLLDGDDKRYARGSYDTCLAKLEEIKRERHLQPMKGRVVVMLHGLAGWRRSMQPLADYLEKNGPFTVVNVAFPSTRGDIAEHARTLAMVMDHLDGVAEINFVAHSLGNLVVRRYLGDHTDPATGRKPDPRIKRFVMLAPPNHGAAAALMLEDHELIALLLGSSASELGADWPEVEKTLAVPKCEFGIIAGGRGSDRGYIPLMKGDNDGLLTVETTKLVGARDFILVPAIHQFTMLNADAQRYTLNFLLKGYFVSADDRRPIDK